MHTHKLKLTKSTHCRHDGGPEIDDIQRTVPTQHLQDLALAFYKQMLLSVPPEWRRLSCLLPSSDDDHASVIWKSERRLQITSTNVKAICQRWTTTAAAPLVKHTLYSSFRGNAATRFGLAQEKTSSVKYLEWLQTQCRSVGATIN